MIRQLLAVITCLLLSFPAKAQTSQCAGNLGENIFVSGDFGSGTVNIVQMDPGIAPGFQYTTSVPFNDGRYTITNDMSRWPSNYVTWLDIGDNSNDPNGYMMVVNATFAPGIFYQQTINGLCDNTLYEFSADVINIVRASVSDHIFPNVSFLIDGVEAFRTGPIPQTEAWRTYGFTFATQPGQDRVTLTLRNNAPGGIGNDLALDNISFRPCGPSANITIDMDGSVCENALYPTLSAIVESDTGFIQWQISNDFGLTWGDIPGATGLTYQSTQLNANLYLFRYLYGNTPQHLQNEKCRIASSSHLIEVLPVNYNIVDTLCAGLNFNLNGIEHATSGTYTAQLTASNGCDSIVTLVLTIVPDPGIESAISTMPPRCAGENNGQISVISVDRGFAPYTFAIDGEPGISTTLPLSVSAGIYQVSVMDRFGCADVHVVTIDDPIQFVIDISGDTALILGYSTLLEATGNDPISTISWNPTAGLACAMCPSTIATPLMTTNYVATAISEAGCLAMDSIFITVDTEPRVFAPNVFSPNGDNVNDSWGISADALNVIRIKRIVIYDRWGNVLFADSNIAVQDAGDLWDGRYKTGYVGTGVYLYLLELEMADSAIVTQSGSITVLR